MGSELLGLLRDELRLLRSQGMESVAVTEESLECLTRAFGGAVKAAAVDPGKTAKAAPSGKPEASTGGPSLVVPEEKPSRKVAAKSDATAKIPSEAPVVEIGGGSKREQWERLRETVLSCPVCRENLNPGKKIVFGVGDIDADLFFCGEAPGADEETEGEPFVGKAGELLDGMIKAMGLQREKVYIGNIMNWRPRTGSSYGNRPPMDEEMAFCLPYLRAQVAVVRPKVIVALGGTATKGLLGLETKGQMGRLRGSWQEFEGIPVMITYHPSFLLHQGSVQKKRTVWEDLLAVMERLSMPISDKQRNFFLAALKS